MNFIKTVIPRGRSYSYIFKGLEYRNQTSAILARNLHQTQSNKNVERNNFVQFKEQNPKNIKWETLIGVTIGATAFFLIYNRKQKIHAASNKNQALPKSLKKSNPNEFFDGLPTYGYEDIEKHATSETRIWVTYKFGVYDITEFIATHPGGQQIIEAAGGAIDPFWDLYQQHNTLEVEEMLENLRIGNYKDGRQGDKNDNLWDNQPKRDPRLIMRSEKPCNAETPKALLGTSFITPNNLFYVRHHLPVPEIDLENYELVVSPGDSKGKTLKLSLDDIKKFPKYTVTASLMCAGNRRSQMNKHKPTKGLDWGPGAIGNAVWAGARLKDVLEAAGVKPDEYKQVQFTGMDLDATGKPYGSSIPLSNAMDERKDVILAYEMNGNPIPRDHGFPVRAFIPGTVGARCVKWLNGITISQDESPSHWQQLDYKGFRPDVDPTAADYAKSTSIQHLPVNSAILYPEEGSEVKTENGFIEVKGYAWAGGGQKILRVDITIDQGKTWLDGAIVEQDKMPAGRHWAWTLWTAKVPVKKGQKNMEIWVKAIDSNYNNQPDNVENIWNIRGVLNNSYDKIKINIK